MNKLINNKDKIFVAGHTGMVGSSLVRILKEQNYKNLVTKNRQNLNLSNSEEVNNFFETEKPDVVILAAAKVGGIYANQNYPVDFIQDNLSIQINIIKSSFKNKVKRLCFLGSSCIYPKYAKQPILENYLLSSSLEPSNEFYAIAKISGLKMCEAYNKQYGFDCFSVMPCNLYGPNDNYHPLNSHVISAFIRKSIIAKEQSIKSLECWGSGNPLREFMYVDDLSNAIIFLLENWQPNNNQLNFINIGSGEEVAIKELIKLITKEVNFKGDIKWDTNKEDGTPRKLLDSSKIKNMGWDIRVRLQEGIKKTIEQIYETELYKEWL